MNIIEEYFIKMTNNISFIELKEDSYVELKGYIIESHIPLPIITDILLEEIKTGDAYDEIKIHYLIDGIIYTLGSDCNFKYKREYIEILYNYDSNIEDYILYKGFKLIEDKNYDAGAVFFRSLTNINNKNIYGIFNYALSLENISKKFFEHEFEEKARLFLLESTNKLETILDINPNFPLVYYKLGYHYKFYEQFLKARIIWEKYLKQNDAEERVEEIRKELELITDDADFEQSVYYINNGEYDLALDKLLRLAEKYEEWGTVFYFIGLAYKGIGKYENAIKFLYKALELDVHNVDVYNELGICLNQIGDLDGAIEIFDKGIKFDDRDYKIIFNRGLTYLQLGNLDKAMEDINTAYKLNPYDVSVKNQKKQLENFMGI